MGARELLHELVAGGFFVEIAADKLMISPASKLTDDMRAAVRAAKPELMALLSGRPEVGGNDPPYRLSHAEGDAAHAEPWDDAACGRFAARVSLFLRRGISATDSDDLAERLHLRDVQADDRRLCLECRHLTGRTGSWRCGDSRAAGVGVDLPRDLVALPQRCPGHLSGVAP